MQWEGRFTCWRQISSSSNCWFCLCRVLPRISLLQVGRWQTQKAAAKRKFPLTAAGIGSGVWDWFELILQRFCVLSLSLIHSTINNSNDIIFVSPDRNVIGVTSQLVMLLLCALHSVIQHLYSLSICWWRYLFGFVFGIVLLYCILFWIWYILIVLIFCSLERYFYRWNSLLSQEGRRRRRGQRGSTEHTGKLKREIEGTLADVSR